MVKDGWIDESMVSLLFQVRLKKKLSHQCGKLMDSYYSYCLSALYKQNHRGTGPWHLQWRHPVQGGTSIAKCAREKEGGTAKFSLSL